MLVLGPSGGPDVCTVYKCKDPSETELKGFICHLHALAISLLMMRNMLSCRVGKRAIFPEMSNYSNVAARNIIRNEFIHITLKIHRKGDVALNA